MNSGGRVRLLHQENQGLIASLSRGIDEPRGAFIARMDGDDISASERFERHVEFLHANPEVGVVGTKIFYIDAEAQAAGTWTLPADVDAIA